MPEAPPDCVIRTAQTTPDPSAHATAPEAPMPHKEPPNVAVLIETDTSWGRRVIRGVTQYAQNHGPWHLVVKAHGSQTPLGLPAGWSGDGVLARVGTEQMQAELVEAGVPVVNVSTVDLTQQRFHRVHIDYEATANLAAKHFLERGYKDFGYVGPLKHPVVRRHAEAFTEALRRQNGTVVTFDYDYQITADVPEIRQSIDEELGDWLETLPKPFGVFSWGTEPGARVLDMCRYRGIAVPTEAAVLADDDDPLLCNATTPPMSAVLHAAEQVGYRAAMRLDHLLQEAARNGGASKSPINHVELIEPVQVTSRASTDAYAVKDAEMLRAVTFIRQNVTRPLSVSEVADAVPVGRRTLERKFRQAFGRTPLEEIRLLRIEKVKELLATTDLPISQVADRTGFSTPEHMTNTFRRVVGQSPLRYRKKLQGT